MAKYDVGRVLHKWFKERHGIDLFLANINGGEDYRGITVTRAVAELKRLDEEEITWVVGGACDLCVLDVCSESICALAWAPLLKDGLRPGVWHTQASLSSLISVTHACARMPVVSPAHMHSCPHTRRTRSSSPERSHARTPSPQTL